MTKAKRQNISPQINANEKSKKLFIICVYLRAFADYRFCFDFASSQPAQSGRVDKRSASTTVIGGYAALIRPTFTIV
jgi:hypothetical protein